MSGFEDDFGELVEPNKEESLLMDEDPAAEFLSREQEQLGDLDEELGAALSASTTAVSGSRSSSQEIPVDIPASKLVKQEPEVLREWREAQMERLREKDEQEESDRDKLREQAVKELEEWYKLHDETLEKTRSTNRDARLAEDQSFVSEIGDMSPGTEWERVSKLCDFNQKTSKNLKDVSRMRSIILQLKQTAVA